MDTEKKVFQYVQCKSFVSPDFWYKLAEVKLDVEKLDEGEREIKGTFTNFNAKNSLIEFDCAAFNR
jgi:ubiquitin-like modifier-activating enzyme ATG7